MEKLIFGFLLSLIITALSVPLAIKLAKRFKLVDDPKLRPHPAHIHKKVIPRAGGIPIFLGITLGIVLLAGLSQITTGIIFSLAILLIVGLLDDALLEFKPLPRLLLQFVPALIAVVSGIGIDFITNPFEGGIMRLDTFQIPVLGLQINLIADFFAVVWIVWMMNMVNWSKGVDGQMPIITLVAFLTIGYVSLGFLNLGDQNQYLPTLLAFICAGASLGFLIFNWHPAKIFPGFSGSTILGFMIAVLSIFSTAKLAIALLVLLVPATDFFYTFFRRIIEKKSPLKGDQKHLHHLLLERGLSQAQVSLLYALSCAILGLLALNLESQGKIFTIIGAGVVIFGAILWLHLLAGKDRNEAD
jgi:UDP-GlcNAc:undecaprenyl-phosphate/decaprenyl-phosphate GlcNAc-1-phosphate transferase